MNRIEVFKRFYALHQARLLHGDFKRDNILINRSSSSSDRSTQVRIIDFENLKGGHRCYWREIPDPEKGKPKDRRDYDCKELRAVETALNIWGGDAGGSSSTHSSYNDFNIMISILSEPRRSSGRDDRRRPSGQQEGMDEPPRSPGMDDSQGNGMDQHGGGGEFGGEGGGEWNGEGGGGEGFEGDGGGEFGGEGGGGEFVNEGDGGEGGGEGGDPSSWPQENDDNDVKVVPEPAAPPEKMEKKKSKKGGK